MLQCVSSTGNHKESIRLGKAAAIIILFTRNGNNGRSRFILLQWQLQPSPTSYKMESKSITGIRWDCATALGT